MYLTIYGMCGGHSMSEGIIVALISSGVTLVVCLINNYSQNKKIIAELNKNNDIQIAEMRKNNELQSYQIQELDKKVEKHNKVIERVYKLEQLDEVEKEQIKVINHRIEDLENYHK